MKFLNEFLILILCIPVAFLGLAYVFDLYNKFAFWITKKFLLYKVAMALLKSKNKEIKDLGWITLRLVFWETKEDRVEIEKISEEEEEK
jgi:hypothetical protein